MKRLVIITLSFSFIIPCVLFAAEPQEALIAKAKAEGKVTFYANITAVEPVMEAFAKNFGMKDEYKRISTDKFFATIATEYEAGKLLADVLQAPIPILDLLKGKGVLASYKSPSTSDYPAWTKRDDKIQIFGIEYVAVLYNKELVKPADVPKKYEDLADPKWRGKIVMANPTTHPTTISWLVGLKEQVFPTENAWMNFIKGLAANKPMFVNSFGPTPAPIESGEKLIAISMPKYILTKAPARLDWAKVEQPLLGTPRGMAITNKAPHPNAARLFFDYWLSRESARILADKVGEYVLCPGVYPPINGIEKAKVLPIRELSDDEIRHWAEEFKKIF